ncbi:MAG TPA: isochorismatase family cysteine hydrolase [Gemmatimonadaceae bacterium]|nr:isochorismatase family cysteine hydrolase [Gemmatimonadaceae bacterium]
MPESLVIDPARSALLIMDYQTGIVNAYGTNQEDLLQRAARVRRTAHDRGVQVIYVTVGFRPGYPEVSARNVSFSTIKQSNRFSGESPEPVHPAVAPESGDITVVKHRVGAFLGTDLDMILRAHDIDTLVLCGIATSGVVLSTLRHAADADYRCIVVRDCCADRDAEVHACLLDKVFPRQATVVTSEQVLAALGGA